MNRLDLVLAALAVSALALASSCRAPERSGAPPRTAAPAPFAAPAPQPWAVTGFRDDETWEMLGLPPDVNPPFENGAPAPRMKRQAKHAGETPDQRLLARRRP